MDSLARALLQRGFELLATGNTRKYLQDKGFTVADVSDVTGEPERFGGRLKTLHHKILGGILLRPGLDESEWPYDFKIGAVVCNFYPFVEKAKECKSLSQLIEWIDIGGPTMVRSAAKNFAYVYCFTNPSQYVRYIASPISEDAEFKRKLSLEAFETVMRVDESIYLELLNRIKEELVIPPLMYGENPHQKAIFSASHDLKPVIFGRLSFNNVRDAEAALRFVTPFTGPAVSVIKHQTLCGASASLDAKNQKAVFEAAWEGDPVSRFGGVLGFNFTPDAATTEILRKKFIELVVMPRSSESENWAKSFYEAKDKKCTVYLVDAKHFGQKAVHKEVFEGALGRLVQDTDFVEIQTKDAASFYQSFGEWVAACSKSNAMVICDYLSSENVAVLAGTGQGQPNRVDALKLLALPRAQDYCTRRERKIGDLTLFSDGFLPFADTVEEMSRFGIKKLVQPGGSKADADVTAAAQKLGVEMTLTGTRHFWH